MPKLPTIKHNSSKLDGKLGTYASNKNNAINENDTLRSTHANSTVKNDFRFAGKLKYFINKAGEDTTFMEKDKNLSTKKLNKINSKAYNCYNDDSLQQSRDRSRETLRNNSISNIIKLRSKGPKKLAIIDSKMKTPERCADFKSIQLERYKQNPIYLNQKPNNNDAFKKRINEIGRRKKNLEIMARRTPIAKKKNLTKPSGRNFHQQKSFNPLNTSKNKSNKLNYFEPGRALGLNNNEDACKTSESREFILDATLNNREASLNYSYNENTNVIETKRDRSCGRILKNKTVLSKSQHPKLKRRQYGSKVSMVLKSLHTPFERHQNTSNQILTNRSKCSSKEGDLSIVFVDSQRTIHKDETNNDTINSAYNNFQVFENPNENKFRMKGINEMKILPKKSLINTNRNIPTEYTQEYVDSEDRAQTLHGTADLVCCSLSNFQRSLNNDIKIVDNEGSLTSEDGQTDNSNGNGKYNTIQEIDDSASDTMMSWTEGRNDIDNWFEQMDVKKDEQIFLIPKYQTPCIKLKPSIYQEHWIDPALKPSLEYFEFT
ncbi:unnamed protein product [Moneuplotes crassus]|uniref:Uncharacterized protein n=1 Tax=Euplotes crassus TaxID=5936 RepID=A0AAD1Y4R1_EUPCR|nr:unnamed protein product [Moneuplotes crassus]